MRISDWSSDVCSSDLRTLEWSTASPAPAYNFAFTPRVQDQDAWFDMKRRGHARPLAGYLPIHMPKNTPAGIVLSGLAMVCGFALIWHIWWLAAVSFADRQDVVWGKSGSVRVFLG